MKCALFCALLVAAGARAQDEPTPFWIVPPPTKTQKPAPPKKTKPRPVKKPPPEETEAPSPPPRVQKKPKPRPRPVEQEPLREPVRTPVEPVRRPAQPSRAPVAAPPPEIDLVAPPSRRTVQPTPQPEAPQPALVPLTPAPVPITPSAPPAAVAMPLQSAQAEPEPEEQPARTVRHISVDAALGEWARSRSDGPGYIWDLSYGLRIGYALFDDRIEAELIALRGGGTEGSPFLSTQLTHDLLALRAFYVLGDRLALLAGGGGGIAIAQTHYSLVDPVDGTAQAVDASGYKMVAELTAAGRARIWGGLEARLEVSALLRDGRLEWVPIAGLGFAFW